MPVEENGHSICYKRDNRGVVYSATTEKDLNKYYILEDEWADLLG